MLENILNNLLKKHHSQNSVILEILRFLQQLYKMRQEVEILTLLHIVQRVQIK